MNIVNKMEEQIKEEIKRITGYTGFNWDEVFFNSGSIDFHDHDLEVYFWVGGYGAGYKFIYDYDQEIGGLFSEDENDKFQELWHTEKNYE
jgi:hypothetical protein